MSLSDRCEIKKETTMNYPPKVFLKKDKEGKQRALRAEREKGRLQNVAHDYHTLVTSFCERLITGTG